VQIPSEQEENKLFGINYLELESVYKIQVKNKARSSVLRNTSPRNRLPLLNTYFRNSSATSWQRPS